VAEGRTDPIVGTASARLTKHLEKRYVFRCIFILPGVSSVFTALLRMIQARKLPGVTLKRYLFLTPCLRFLPQIAKSVNSDLLKGFTVPEVAQKHSWPESLVWSQALVKANDFDRFKPLQWGIRT
jgi:hypothetical protein